MSLRNTSYRNAMVSKEITNLIYRSLRTAMKLWLMYSNGQSASQQTLPLKYLKCEGKTGRQNDCSGEWFRFTHQLKSYPGQQQTHSKASQAQTFSCTLILHLNEHIHWNFTDKKTSKSSIYGQCSNCRVSISKNMSCLNACHLQYATLFIIWAHLD